MGRMVKGAKYRFENRLYLMCADAGHSYLMRDMSDGRTFFMDKGFCERNMEKADV